jgi:hypothetical protein
MSAAYPAGTVAMVTALNRPTPYRAFFDGQTWREFGADAFCVDVPTDVRPLVVLDLADPVRTVEALRLAASQATNCRLDVRGIADQIEAQVKPPRIPEPGWGEKVIAHVKGFETMRQRWVATKNGRTQEWHSETGHKYHWSDLVDPVLVRDGVEDGAS